MRKAFGQGPNPQMPQACCAWGWTWSKRCCSWGAPAMRIGTNQVLRCTTTPIVAARTINPPAARLPQAAHAFIQALRTFDQAASGCHKRTHACIDATRGFHQSNPAFTTAAHGLHKRNADVGKRTHGFSKRSRRFAKRSRRFAKRSQAFAEGERGFREAARGVAMATRCDRFDQRPHNLGYRSVGGLFRQRQQLRLERADGCQELQEAGGAGVIQLQDLAQFA